MKNLTLNLKGIYFDQIKAGIKPEEFRLYNPYWQKRLLNKSFDQVIIKRGYPSNQEKDKIITKKWNGYVIKKIVSPHFGESLVTVFAIDVR